MAMANAIDSATLLDNFAQPHAELNSYVGADNARRRPLASADAEGAALDDELTVHFRGVAGLGPGKGTFNDLLRTLQAQLTARQIAAGGSPPDISRMKFGTRKPDEIEPFARSDGLVHVRAHHVGAADDDRDVEPALRGLVRVEAHPRFEFLEHARRGILFERGHEFEPAWSGFQFPIGGVSRLDPRNEDCRGEQKGSDHPAPIRPDSMRVSTSLCLTK